MDLTYEDLEVMEALVTTPTALLPEPGSDVWRAKYLQDVANLINAVRELDAELTNYKQAYSQADEDLDTADAILNTLTAYVEEGHGALDQLTPTPPRQVADGAGELQHMTFAGRVKYFASAMIADGKMRPPQVAPPPVELDPSMPAPSATPSDTSEWAALFSEQDTEPSDDSFVASPTPLPSTEAEQLRTARNEVVRILEQLDTLSEEDQVEFWRDLPAEQRPFVEQVAAERTLLAAIGQGLSPSDGPVITKINFVDPDEADSADNYTYDIASGQVEPYTPA